MGSSFYISFTVSHMFKWVLRSGMMMVCLLMVQSDAGAFEFSDVSEIIQKGPQRGLEALQSVGEGSGAGFYSAIYEDTVRNPNRLVEEQIKDRFGINFTVDLSLPNLQGQFLFKDFFRNPGGALDSPSAPVLKDSLQSDCIRVKSAQAQDEERRWELLANRLRQRKEETSVPADQVEREVLLRLVEAVDDESRRRTERAFSQIPEYRSLNSQQQLLRCYEDLSGEIDFELRLQSLLNPTRKHLENLQTFMNGRLDDFQQSIPLTDVKYGTTFPQYDLLFDIDVIDMIFFGTAVSSSTGQVSKPSGVGAEPDDFADYEEIVAATENPNIVDLREPAESSSGVNDSSSGLSSTDSRPSFESDGSQFGSSSRDFSGPLCVETATGLDLDYSPVRTPEERRPVTGSDGVTSGVRAVPTMGTVPRDLDVDRVVQESFAPNVSSLTQEGPHSFGKNRKALCEGTLGVNIGNDFLQLLFCLDIRFSKLGKTWQTSREENCIACHVTAMNQIFEEKVLNSSVRPHKNTGTIMESAICEDGFGDDVGFHFFLEWVPVKFYPDICYPKGGVTDSSYAELVGYPEIVARVNRPGFYVDCQVDFLDEEAADRCREAIGGEQLSYEEFRASYLSTLNQGIESIDDIDKKASVWARLAGDQGVAERELHFFLYRSGKEYPIYGENELFEADFRKRLDALRMKMEEIQRSPNLIVDAVRDEKTQQIRCLKGSYAADASSECEGFEDTFRQLEKDMNAERLRIGKITQRWNAKSSDFNNENSCAIFTGSGPFEAFWDTFEEKFSLDYYLETDTRKIQTASEQVTGQISANTEIEDLNRLFSEINRQVEFIEQGKTEEALKQEFEANQEQSLLLYRAFAVELTNFRSAMEALTDWWAKMVDENFISKSGQRISVLESFFEKLR